MNGNGSETAKVELGCRDLLDVVDCAVVVLDPATLVKQFNRAAEQLFGWPRSDVLGQSWTKTLGGVGADHATADHTLFGESVRNALAGTNTTGVTCTLLARDGSPRRLLWSFSPANGPNGHARRVVAVGHLLSEEHRDPGATSGPQINAVSPWPAHLGAIASMVVHDLGGPLTVSHASCQLLREQLERHSGGAALAQLAAKTAEGLDLAFRLVRDFRETLRGDESIHEDVDLLSVVLRAWRCVETTASDRDIQLWLDAEQPYPLVRGNRLHLLRAFDNVLRNAIEAIDRHGNVQMSVSITEGSLARVLIRDDGPGVPAGIDPFQLLVTSKTSGTGLGLAIASHFINEHGGTISLEPARPRGTLARIELPLARRSDAAR